LLVSRVRRIEAASKAENQSRYLAGRSKHRENRALSKSMTNGGNGGVKNEGNRDM